MANLYDPLKIQFDEKPRIIADSMDKLAYRNVEYEEQIKKKKLIPRIFFFSALGLFLLDLFFGFSSHFFILSAIVLGIIWLFLKIRLWMARPKAANFSPRFEMIQKIFKTIQDDLHPKRTLFGHMDLSGWEQESKIAQEVPTSTGLTTVAHYRDEWLSLRGKLYDGNMMRLSMVERTKVRKSYKKRSASGKYKTKPPKYKEDLQEMKVRIAANEDVYTVRQAGPEITIGKMTVQVQTTDGIINVTGVTSQEPTFDEILSVLKWAYDHLQPRASV